MAFMRATVSDTKDYLLTSDELEGSALCTDYNIHLPVGGYYDDDLLEDEEIQEEVDRVFKDLKISSFEIVYKFYGHLRAPGYMDQTDYFFGDSRAEVAEDLIAAFFDGERQHMDDDEIEDLSLLESIADGGIKDETT